MTLLSAVQSGAPTGAAETRAERGPTQGAQHHFIISLLCAFKRRARAEANAFESLARRFELAVANHELTK